MNATLVLVAMYVRDLLTYDEQLIRIGRQDFEQEAMETAYIVVDTIAPRRMAAQMETYDGEAEEMSYGGVWSGVVTIDFYGAGAYTRAMDFVYRSRSQSAYELKRTLGITIYNPKSMTDVKALTGAQYGEKVQVELTVEHSTETNIETLRIDSEQLEIWTERGLEYNG